jgi:hypothetical protein
VGSNLLTWRTTGLSYDHFTWAAYAGDMKVIYPDTENEIPGGCSDGEDNDLDGPIDCADSDCIADIACNAPAPVVTFSGMVVLMTLLMLVGWLGLGRKRRLQE